MSIMYKINNTEVRRLATVFIGQPVEVQARFIDVVAFVGGQIMPGRKVIGRHFLRDTI